MAYCSRTAIYGNDLIPFVFYLQMDSELVIYDYRNRVH